jgi:predicted alpha/beta hydrolase family esterase
MRFQPLIVPGWRNSGPNHWQTRWEQALPHARRVMQRDWDKPQPAEWNSALARAVDDSDSPVLLIAHSLGCIAVASLPVALHSKVAGALLVAPPDIERAGAPASVSAFGAVPRQPLTFHSVVVASDDDPYCTLARVRLFAADWGSQLTIVPQGGHLNADSGLGDWPVGMKLLTALRRRVAWRHSPPRPRIAPLTPRISA